MLKCICFSIKLILFGMVLYLLRNLINTMVGRRIKKGMCFSGRALVKITVFAAYVGRLCKDTEYKIKSYFTKTV